MCLQYRFIALTILIVAGGSLLGKLTADYFKSRQQSDLLQERKTASLAILPRMDNIDVGNRIPDWRFYNIYGEEVELSKTISSVTILSFFALDCQACFDELQLLSDLIDSSNASRILLISSDNPFELRELKLQRLIKDRILFDHEGTFRGIFGVFTFPFHIVISEELSIVEVIPDALIKADIERLVRLQNVEK